MGIKQLFYSIMSRRTNLNKNAAICSNLRINKPLSDESRAGGFVAKFHNGYIARSIVQFLKESIAHFSLKASIDSISISEKLDTEVPCLVNININIESLKSYLYVSEQEEFEIGLSSSSLWNDIKSVSKQTPVILTKLCGVDHLEIQFDERGHNITPYTLHGSKNEHICFPSYKKNIDQAINFSLKDFTKICSEFKQKGSSCVLAVYQTFVSMEANSLSGTESYRRILGDLEIPLERLTGLDASNIISKISNGDLYSSLTKTHPDIVGNYSSENELSVENDEINDEGTNNGDEDSLNNIKGGFQSRQLGIVSGVLELKMIKALSKLSACETGIVRILGEEGCPILILINIINLGEIKIFIDTN